jgi:hypothetical protein
MRLQKQRGQLAKGWPQGGLPLGRKWERGSKAQNPESWPWRKRDILKQSHFRNGWRDWDRKTRLEKKKKKKQDEEEEEEGDE